MVNVCDINVMKPLLAQHGFHFSKAKGQNFLTQRWVPERIAEDSGVTKDVGVLEIGPGIGPLTQQLALRAGKVCAVELDTRLEPILAETVGEFDNLQIIWGDVLNSLLSQPCHLPDGGLCRIVEGRHIPSRTVCVRRLLCDYFLCLLSLRRRGSLL